MQLFYDALWSGKFWKADFSYLYGQVKRKFLKMMAYKCLDIVRGNDVSLPSFLFFFKMFKLVITEHDLISKATPCLICVALLVYFSIRLDFCLHGLLLNKVFPSNVVYHFSLHLKYLVLSPSSQTVRWLAWQLRTLIGCLKCQLLMPFWCL